MGVANRTGPPVFSAAIPLDAVQLEWLSCCRVKVNTYSLSKYSSMISLNGGWDWFQNLLQVCGKIVQKAAIC